MLPIMVILLPIIEKDPIWGTFIEIIKAWSPQGLKLPLGFWKWKYSWEIRFLFQSSSDIFLLDG